MSKDSGAFKVGCGFPFYKRRRRHKGEVRENLKWKYGIHRELYMIYFTYLQGSSPLKEDKNSFDCLALERISLHSSFWSSICISGWPLPSDCWN